MAREDTSIKRRPSQDHLRNYIIDRIESGALSPGDSLVSARQLSDMFGISFHAVRAVLRQLEDEGWLQSKSRIGTFVAHKAHAEGEPVEHIQLDGSRVVLLQPGHHLRGFQETAFYAEINRSLEEYLREHGVELTYSPTELGSLDRFLERELESIGVAIVPVAVDLYPLVQKYHLPCVGLINEPAVELAQPYDLIASDNEDAAYAATSHLISLGHDRICFLGGGEASSGEERYRGFRRAMDEAGLDVDPALTEVTYWTVQGGYESMLRVLSRGRDVTGVFAANDLLAFGAIRAVHESGRAVPTDVSIVGFDDWELAGHTLPPLTTMRVDRARIGALAGQLALKRLADPERESSVIRLPSALVVRGSTRSLAVATEACGG